MVLTITNKMTTYPPQTTQRTISAQVAGGYSPLSREIEAMHHLGVNTSVDCSDSGVQYKAVINKIVLMYPFVGGTSNSCRLNFANPGTYDFTPVASPTFTKTQCTLNGSTQYLNTNYTLSNTGDLSVISGMGIKRRGAGTGDTDATYGVASSGNSYGIVRSDTNRQTFILSNRSDASTGSLAIAAIWSSGWSSTTTLVAYRNSSVLKTNTSLIIGNAGNKSVIIGAYNGGAGPVWGPAQPTISLDFFWLRKEAWTDAEEISLHNAVSYLTARLAR